MSSIIVVGHKNPDNDAISAAVGYAYLKNELARRAGEEAVFEPVRLGPLPPETEWIMGERGIEQPRLIESVPEGAKVILVDHNEMLQSVDGLNTDDLVEVVDHHRLGGLTTAQPIRVNVKPVGSTAAIVAREFEIEGVELPESIAALLLGAMLTDTVIMKSPTTTDFDRDMIARTAKTLGVDPVEYGMDIFKCRSNPAELPEAIKALVAEKGYQFVLFFATDILAEGSQFICEGDTQFVSDVFGVNLNDGESAWMPGVLSRKKQVAAPILAA